MTGIDSVVVIGGSWGGIDASRTILRALPSSFIVPIVVVLHRSAHTHDDVLARMLGVGVERPVHEADDKTPLAPGGVYVAPADYHLLVDDGHLTLSTEPPVRFSRPSIDLLFESAADQYGPGVVAVVLTGANDDGAAGARRVLARGGRVVVQDPVGAERPDMPTAAIAAAEERALVVPLEEIASVLAGVPSRSRS